MAFKKMMAGIAMSALIGFGGVALGQTRVDTKNNWDVYEHGSGAKKICWIASQPTKSTARRGGQNVAVRRGDIFVMVSVRPADKIKNEVSFISGYPFKKSSKVTVRIGSDSFTMFTDGENAWTSSRSDDDKLVAAMRAGASAVLTGTSSRGTETTDTVSLSGFTAALQTATSRCN